METPGRNDLCLCGSGKKFKKCCQNKMIGKKFMASKIEPKQTTSNIVSFFKNKITQVNTLDKTSNENLKPQKNDIKNNVESEEESLLTK